MDPNTVLEDIRRYIGRVGVEGNELTEAFDALDEWLSKGGYLPEDWEPFAGGRRVENPNDPWSKVAQ